MFALVFAALVTPVLTADRWLAALGMTTVVERHPAPITIRVPMFAGIETANARVGGGGIVIARGESATIEQQSLAGAIAEATPGGALPYAAFGVLALVLAVIFTHHMRRSTRGRLVRVQVVSLIAIVLLAAAAKTILLGTALSVLVVPVALLAIVPTMVLDRIVGLATGVLAALVVALLGPFDLGVAILMLVQAATAGLVVAERPKQRWRAALAAGLVTTLFTAATYLLLVYLTTGAMPAFDDPLTSPLVAAAAGPAIAMVLAVPLIPLYQLLVGEITQGKLVELEDLSHPLLRQIAERSPGTWQHSLTMANMAEIAANAIGANGRLVRVGALFHDLGKSLQPKYFIENLEPGETSPHDRLPPEVSCDAIFAHVTEGIVTARKQGLHERIVDFMHMHHGDGVLEYFWGKCREQGNPQSHSIERFRYPGHPPQSRETAILAICDAVEAASRTLKKPEPAAIDSLVQRIVYGKLHLGQLDESGLSMADLRRVSDSLRETIRHANHGRIEYPWQKAQQDASASQQTTRPTTGTEPRLDSLDRKPKRETGVTTAMPEPAEPVPSPTPSGSMPIELGEAQRKRPSQDPLDTAKREALSIADTAQIGRAAAAANLSQGKVDLAISETAPQKQPEPASASQEGEWRQLSDSKIARLDDVPPAAPGPAPDGVITPSTFTGMPPPESRKRAATLPPTPPPRKPPTAPPGRPGTASDAPRAAHDSSVPVSKATLTGVPPRPTGGIPEPRAGSDSSSPVFASSPRPAPMKPEGPGMSTLQGRPAPNHLPASSTTNAPRQAPSPSTDARTSGPPPPSDLDNAVTNPPPLRRNPSGPQAPKLAGVLLPEDDASSTAPRLPVTPITHVGHVSGQIRLEDNARTQPTMPKLELPLRAPPTDPPRTSLAERIDAALEDEWGNETPIVPPTRAELRALLGAPDPTRKQSIAEIERLHRAAKDDSAASEPELFSSRRPAPSTAEVDPDDIEAAIELAPPARRPTSVAIAKPKKPE